MTVSIDPNIIEKIREKAQLTGKIFIEALQSEFNFSDDQLLNWLVDLTHYQSITIKELEITHPDFSVFNFNECVNYQFIPIDEGNTTTIVLSDPFNPVLRNIIRGRINGGIDFKVAHINDIKLFFQSIEESHQAMTSFTSSSFQDNSVLKDDEAISLKSISEDSSPIVKLVHATLYDALKSAVSDIHMETVADGLTIKYRIDGLLSKVSHLRGLETADQIISRIKVMAELDIAERRVPQDGRFKVYAFGRNIDFRVSIMPSIHGEDAVLRILDKQALTENFEGLKLENLGFSGTTLNDLKRLCHEPYGMILVTGPTGSGKTTTLYAAISEINNGNEKIITIEDPVEYQLPGILQIPVNEKKGLTFAKGLRSILRHDPDKILVGEIRDNETAQIAIQSALTGHLVFTTVHANNVLDVIGRFIHMGVDPYSFVSALNGILAQRLIRINCSSCAEKFIPSDKLLEQSKLDRNSLVNFNFMAGKGCSNCRGTGYKGRRAISELLILNDHLREMIISKQPISKIKEYAISNNTRFLRQAALELVKVGSTTLEEVNRVTFVE